ncbi:MAG: protease modulator HflK N-terminal domain-containing protein, partial [Gemmatimonadetes bacterium]|nr:protease modulator HflK N-terminal domain-containing protein [Gemmatimonadota bacterium]
MAWNPQGGGQGPWGGGGSGPQGPNIEEILRRGQDRFRRL